MFDVWQTNPVHQLQNKGWRLSLKWCFNVVLFRPKDCYYDAEGGTDHTLKIPYDKCGIKEDSEGFLSQVLVVQHDDWLIFPGDLAFTLQCDHNQVARIGLSDPDPSSAGKELPKHKKSTVESQSGSVTFTPEDIRPRKKKKKTAKTELWWTDYISCRNTQNSHRKYIILFWFTVGLDNSCLLL